MHAINSAVAAMILLISLYQPSNALKCYSCSYGDIGGFGSLVKIEGRSHPNCRDPFNKTGILEETCDSSKLLPSAPKNFVCGKIKAADKDNVIILRGCIPVPTAEKKCETHYESGITRSVCACLEDGCNSTIKPEASFALFLIAAAILSIASRVFK